MNGRHRRLVHEDLDDALDVEGCQQALSSAGNGLAEDHLLAGIVQVLR